VDVYIFQADIYCEGCGEEIKKEIEAAGNAPADAEDEHTFDSDDYPKGPYPDGGGESDTPQHCGGCRAFLYNPLTQDGYAYLRESARRAGAVWWDEDGVDVERSAKMAQDDWDATGRHGGDDDDDAPLAQWLRYYPEAWTEAGGF
jgi:sarcosine oxidase delta subunit